MPVLNLLDQRHGVKNKIMRRFKLCILCISSIAIIVLFIYNGLDYRLSEPIVNSMEIIDLDEKINRQMKYILVWSDPKEDDILKELGNSQEEFVMRECHATNCYVTSNRYFFEELYEFDVIIFNGKEIVRNQPKMPKKRSTHQKYVFATIESSDYYPICDWRFDRFFNWTWTYKLNSDENYGYIIVRNKSGDIVGPKETMHWMKVENMDPIDQNVKAKLMTKSRIAAWFVSNCYAPSGRNEFVNEVNEELKKYDMTVDIFGECGTKVCSLNSIESCFQLIEQDYYFYFSFENSFAEDYVTEKVLHGLKNYAVPVVYGDANYTRFMPDGIYLNARQLGVKELVNQMIILMNDKQKYYDFFRWHNHYTYHSLTESPETDPYCNLCSKINDKEVFSKNSVYYNFKEWWTPPWRC